MAARNYWLVKSEPSVFSFDDLLAAPKRTTSWEGVRNYAARNFMRDGMRKGDLVLFHHSNADPSAIAGICEVVREAYPDPTQFDPGSEYHDPKAKAESPTWLMVDLKAVQKLARPLALDDLRGVKGLEQMELLRKGSRLSVQPVSAKEFAIVAKLGGVAVPAPR